MLAATRVYLEVGRTWTFAAAVDWPGWCRRGRGEEGALDALVDYTDRYAAVAGPDFAPGELHVVGRLPGTSTTDFGAPDARGPWDDEPLPAAEAFRLAGLLEASWQAFDAVMAGAPAELRKGPRGGGRDRDAIADHVREAERSYGRKIGVRLPPRTPWPARGLRAGAGRRCSGRLVAGALRRAALRLACARRCVGDRGQEHLRRVGTDVSPKLPPAAAQSPEQISVLGFACRHGSGRRQ